MSVIISGSGPSLATFAQRLSDAAQQGVRDLVLKACEELIEHARATSQIPGPADAENWLKLLRRYRRFEALSVLADALIRMGREELFVSRLYAQGLIDQGLLLAAREVLRGLTRRAADDPAEHSEVTGLMGRVNKQIYVDARGRPSDQARQALRQAIACYREVYEKDRRTHLWHGVNLLALMHRARTDGIGIKGLPDSTALAGAIIEAVRNPQGRTVNGWDYACAAEACIALEDWDAATDWIARYIEHESTDHFALAGTLRQLTEVWRFTPETPEAGQLVVALRGALLGSRDGRLELTPGQLQHTAAALDNPGPRLERVLGTVGLQTLTWLRTGMERARSVALIRGPGGRGIGTGFLIKGGDLHPALGDELLVVTNAHVVSELQDDGGIEPDQAMITFEAQNGAAGSPQPQYHVAKLLWNSPKQHLDTSLLRLSPGVAGIAPCPIANSLPALNNDQRVYIIGHPKGGELSFSLQDNELLDHEGPPAGKPSRPERCLIHYRAPTEPGSSGSPVFNQAPDWQVIGLHHAGGEYAHKLNGRSGTYAANEAIWIQSIAKAMAVSFGSQ
ncbi:MAG: trypsin-like peptidase domain-containing protein [Alphaproteobacteria bacterium]|nr:trypsin-like peptidase domain-containing protein [Alphaproteobacteria bacterium]